MASLLSSPPSVTYLSLSTTTTTIKHRPNINNRRPSITHKLPHRLRTIVSSSAMDSSSNPTAAASPEDILIDASPMLRVLKTGVVERFMGAPIVPPAFDPKTNVDSKDVVISAETSLAVRIFLPKIETNPSNKKLPLLVYFHGGAFCIESAFSSSYHNYMNAVACEANIIAVSIDYRLAPEHPIPAAYEDSWEALKWVGSHHNGSGPEEWINQYADLNNVFFSGDSAGANIAHHMGVRLEKEKIEGLNLKGMILVHPYFWGKEPLEDEEKDPAVRDKIEGLWKLACPKSTGTDDLWMNVTSDPNIGAIACNKMLVCVAEKDVLRPRGLYYCEMLKKSGWGGEIEVVESEGEAHVFHMIQPSCENALALLNKVAEFINKD